MFHVNKSFIGSLCNSFVGETANCYTHALVECNAVAVFAIVARV